MPDTKKKQQKNNTQHLAPSDNHNVDISRTQKLAVAGLNNDDPKKRQRKKKQKKNNKTKKNGNNQQLSAGNPAQQQQQAGKASKKKRVEPKEQQEQKNQGGESKASAKEQTKQNKSKKPDETKMEKPAAPAETVKRNVNGLWIPHANFVLVFNQRDKRQTMVMGENGCESEVSGSSHCENRIRMSVSRDTEIGFSARKLKQVGRKKFWRNRTRHFQRHCPKSSRIVLSAHAKQRFSARSTQIFPVYSTDPSSPTKTVTTYLDFDHAQKFCTLPPRSSEITEAHKTIRLHLDFMAKGYDKRTVHGQKSRLPLGVAMVWKESKKWLRRCARQRREEKLRMIDVGLVQENVSVDEEEDDIF